jgi:cyclase
MNHPSIAHARPLRLLLTALLGVALGSAGMSSQAQTPTAAKAPDSGRKGRQTTAAPAPSAAQQELEVVRVRDNIYVLVGQEANTTVQIGADGVLVVNTQTAAMAPKIIEAIRKLTDQPIRMIANTDALPHNTGGNLAISKVAKFIAWRGEIPAANIMAHENVLQRMSGALPGSVATPDAAAWPQDTYYKASMDTHFNGEAIQLIYQPNARTDGDSIVFFRGSDVICAGDIYRPDTYPSFDESEGGTFQGLIDALNRIIDLAVPDINEEGGTMVVSGHGRVSDEYEIVIYRDMLTIIRERVQDMIGRGLTLKQVQDAKPSLDYDGIYGTDKGPANPQNFIAAVYADLKAHPASGTPGAGAAQ